MHTLHLSFSEKMIFVCISCQQIIRMFLRAASNAFLMAILHLFLKECNIKTRFYSSPSPLSCLDLYLIKIFPDLKLGSGSPIFQIIGFIHNISSDSAAHLCHPHYWTYKYGCPTIWIHVCCSLTCIKLSQWKYFNHFQLHSKFCFVSNYVILNNSKI